MLYLEGSSGGLEHVLNAVSVPHPPVGLLPDRVHDVLV